MIDDHVLLNDNAAQRCVLLIIFRQPLICPHLIGSRFCLPELLIPIQSTVAEFVNNVSWLAEQPVQSGVCAAVIKPIFGAASIGVVRVNNLEDLESTYQRVVKELAGARIVAGALEQAEEQGSPVANGDTSKHQPPQAKVRRLPGCQACLPVRDIGICLTVLSPASPRTHCCFMSTPVVCV